MYIPYKEDTVVLSFKAPINGFNMNIGNTSVIQALKNLKLSVERR